MNITYINHLDSWIDENSYLKMTIRKISNKIWTEQS